MAEALEVQHNKNKRMLWLIALAAFTVLFVLLLTPREVRAVPQFEDAIITGDQVNMRLRPSTDSPVVLKFDETTRVGVFCEEVDGWYRIIYGNYRGYVSKEYVFLSSTDVLVGNVTSDAAKVYQNPAEYSEVKEELSAGEGVTIKNISGDYYQIEYGEKSETGYMNKALIQTSTAKKPVSLLKEGMKGVEVKKMQTELRKRGFLDSSATGEFAEKTKEALMDFQEMARIPADGVAGAQTLELLYGDNDIKTTMARKYGITDKVELSDWSEIRNVFRGFREGASDGTKAVVTDVKTGINYNVIRFGGWYHADCVPASKEDTEKMKKANGGEWNWNRRAIWVTVGGHTYAASQNSQPHTPDVNANDGFPGHFCIHFNGSKVHETEKPCPRHQAQVQVAYRAAQ